MSELILPFKPFTLDEVSAITGATSKLIDLWTRSILRPKLGEEGTRGWDVMQAFGIFVGHKFLCEGASWDKGSSIALYVGTLTEQLLKTNLDKGCDFPVVEGSRGTLVPAPRNLRLGKALNLTVLLAEFKANLAKVFPNSPSVN